MDSTRNLAAFRKFEHRLPISWSAFLLQRQSRLVQQDRNGTAAEKVAENIVEDFFTIALDWSMSDLNNQLQYADIVLTKMGIKRLLVEVKRPGSLNWDQRALENALAQARRYADEQRVPSIAVSDGVVFYAADIVNGGLKDRARLRLDMPSCSVDSWWVSTEGIYRPATLLDERATISPPSCPGAIAPIAALATSQLLHPKYKIPAECFAYVGDASDPSTWKLPYRLLDGGVDQKRLPGAIRAILTNYRGAHARSVPEAAMPDVLVRLGKAAAELRKLPGQTPAPLDSYRQLRDALFQIGRLSEVLEENNCSSAR